MDSHLSQLPADFVSRTAALMGDGLWRVVAEALTGDAPTSIRLNPLKCADDGWSPVNADGEVEWCRGGYYLTSRPNFTFDPLLHAGMYYVQEASSMFLDLVLRQYCADRPVMMLDMCAAPGGKSTVARAALPDGSLLVSNEPIRQRAQILAENMRKFGHEDVIVTNNYPHELADSGITFNVILTDVPCSGEGMFRKDPAARDEWSVQNVDKCRRLQREIVTEAWRCLRPGGLLIYSTCTFNSGENEENVAYICGQLGAEAVSVDIKNTWGITGSLLSGFDMPVYRFLPGLARGEGLFMAVMRKSGDSLSAGRSGKAKKGRNERRRSNADAIPAGLTEWLASPSSFQTVRTGDTFTAIPTAWKDVYDAAARSLKVISAGVELGEAKGKDVVPSQALALSRALRADKFPSVSLDYGQAVSYLRKEAVTLPDGTPRGYILVTYRGVPLGFEKNIGNRANNLYPAEWKIRSTHTPDRDNRVIDRKTDISQQ